MASNANFLLTPQQQELLFAALNANRPPTSTSSSLTVSPAAVNNPVAATKAAGLTSSLDDTSFLDYDYSFDGDTSLDFSINEADQSNFIEDPADGDDTKTESVPSNDGNDSPDKRSHPDDDDDETSASKRRESAEKVPKKPGRKPLTAEPSSNQPQQKRKAQNRAAQRAFRERKEKHLKDLEDKVAELEKASEAANSENDVLRAQVDKMTAELNEYKKRMALVTKARSSYVPTGHQVFGNPILSNINDVNFQFEFPKFGQLPGPGDAARSSSSTSATNNNNIAANGNAKRLSSIDTMTSPTTDLPGLSTSATSAVNSPAELASGNGLKKARPQEDLSKLSNAFTPPTANGNCPGTARGSMDSGSTSSPSASSHSNTAPSSSCGTSPEPYTQSPMGFKPVDTLTTIGEEQPVTFANMATTTNPDLSHFANVDITDMSWLNNQSSFQFDPQLFGDYREPQENVLAGGGFDDSFFNDALDVDFTTPFNTALSPIGAQKSSLIAQIDAAKEGEFSSSSLAAAGAAKPVTSASGQLLTCNKIWEHLQNCPKVQNGDFDLDGLCSDLQKKAKCSGSGAVVDETDFKNVMKKYLDKDPESDCSQKFIAGITGTTA